MGQEVRFDALRAKHAEIENILIEEERRPLPDFQFVHELKRKKLNAATDTEGKTVKDELTRIAVS